MSPVSPLGVPRTRLNGRPFRNHLTIAPVTPGQLSASPAGLLPFAKAMTRRGLFLTRRGRGTETFFLRPKPRVFSVWEGSGKSQAKETFRLAMR